GPATTSGHSLRPAAFPQTLLQYDPSAAVGYQTATAVRRKKEQTEWRADRRLERPDCHQRFRRFRPARAIFRSRVDAIPRLSGALRQRPLRDRGLPTRCREQSDFRDPTDLVAQLRPPRPMD